jgi:hypothetical protein
MNRDTHIEEFYNEIKEQFSTTERTMGEFKVLKYFSITLVLWVDIVSTLTLWSSSIFPTLEGGEKA